MSASEPDVIEIVEPEAKLRADEWIGRRIHFSGDAVRLEAEDAGCDVVYVVSPTCDDWVSIDFGAWHAGSRERAFKGIPGLLVGNLFFEADAASLADEGVLPAAAESALRYLESPQVITSSDFLQKKWPHLHCDLEKPSLRKVSVG